MDLKTFLAPFDAEKRDAFALRCSVSKGHLQNVMYGFRPCATDLAVDIERESGMKVRRWELRPEDWYRHWPELIGTAGAPAVPPCPTSRVREAKARASEAVEKKAA